MISVNPPSYINTSEYGTVTTTIVGIGVFRQCMEDDLEDIIFNEDEFAEPVQYTHVTGEEREYIAIVDDPNYSSNVGTNIDISTREMCIRLQESKLARRPNNKDVVIVRGISYNIIDPDPDGVGTITLKLQKVGGF